MKPVYGASTRSLASSRPKKSVFRCDHTRPTVATGVRLVRYSSFALHQRITGSAVRYMRRSSW